jgi:glycosyltransferase involved in cell wall biosynthesis
MDMNSERPTKPKLLHVLPTVGQGGAERVASEVIRSTGARYDHHIVCLIPEPPFFDFGETEITSLGMRRGELSVAAALRFRSAVRHLRPDLVQGWLYHGSLISTFARNLCPAVIWSIHNTNLDPRRSKRLTRATNRLCAWLSPYVPDRIIYATEEARLVHEAIGYAREKGGVIENGIDMTAFDVREGSRSRARAELQIDEDRVAVAQIGRFDPQKDHATALTAFRLLMQAVPNSCLILAGDGCVPENTTLAELISAEGLNDAVKLLGPRQDIRELLAGIDVVLIASAYGEAMPLVGLEAAATGTLLVTTDVGSASELVLRPEHVVPPRNAEAMAAALISAVRHDLCKSEILKHRVRERFDLNQKLAEYVDLYDTLLSGSAHHAT